MICPVEFARFLIDTLRSQGFSDPDILSRYATPHEETEAEFDEKQLAGLGKVLISAAAYKTEMRRLLVQ
jgi:hypothetical protein